MTPVSNSSTAYNLATLVVARRDNNANQRIERNEWKGAREQYDRFDRNDDGGVSIEEIRTRLATLPATEQTALEKSLKASQHLGLTAGVAGLGFACALMGAVPAAFGAVSGVVPALALGVGVLGAVAWGVLAFRAARVGYAEPRLEAAFKQLAE